LRWSGVWCNKYYNGEVDRYSRVNVLESVFLDFYMERESE
jgi:hypothetical protein